VSLSTTLATNSLVEGKGARVGLIISVPNESTFRVPSHVPADEVAVIRGAHNRQGDETAPLDLVAAGEAIRHMKNKVDAFAVSGYFSIYNAAHELRLRELLAAECGYPVVCGHELSSGVGMLERAVTAALNSRLLPVVGELLDAVIAILAKKSIAAPLMVVRGDASLISEKAARTRPVETILSGPAASVIGASWLTGLDDAVVVDMGGTTTDIGILSGSAPTAREHGALVGGWRTRTQSIDVWTAGVGGDSRISVNSGDEIHIGPRRAIPLSLAAVQYPPLMETMEELAGTSGVRLKDLNLDFFTLVRLPSFLLEKYERAMLNALDGKVLHRDALEREAGIAINLDRFVTLGCVAEVSFTPTDLLHASKALDLWGTEASELALAFYRKKTGMGPEKLVGLLFDRIIEKLQYNIVAKLLTEDGIIFPSHESHEFLGSLLRLDGHGGVSSHFTMAKPLIAVGAPVAAYFPTIAKRLGAKLVIPEHAEVANAAGAVIGRVVASAQVLVRPSRPIGFAVIAADEHRVFDDYEPAVAHGKQLAQSLAERRALAVGGRGLETTLKTDETTAPLASGWGKVVFIELKIVATAVGKPF
jgi:N-methylhydantoinase A/oxoprolinase/acetone carboxylase beta subunit